MPELATLYYVHDPMCSWCWGFKPCWDELQRQLSTEFADRLGIAPLVGGLAPDTDAPMPAELQATISTTWKTIAEQLGTEFNFDFWQNNIPRRSTYMSCRAVLAAEAQVEGGGSEMLRCIQEAYYLQALNPSDSEVLTQLATNMALDAHRFGEALQSRALQLSLRETFRLVRRLPIQGFPSLVLMRSDVAGQHSLPNSVADTLVAMDEGHLRIDYIETDYRDARPMFLAVRQLMESAGG